MHSTGRREDTYGYPSGVAIIPEEVWKGLEAFKHILVEAGGTLVADHEHSATFLIPVHIANSPGLSMSHVQVDMAIHETKRIHIISRAEGMSGSIADRVQNPWAIYMTFGRPGTYGNLSADKPVVADFPGSMTAVHFAYLCLRTLVNEWQAQLPDIPFPFAKRRIKMPDGVELLAEQLSLPASVDGDWGVTA